MDEREGGLAAWQWRLYADGHRDRRNLLVHGLTVPAFDVGTVALLFSPLAGAWLAPAGLVAMVGAMAAQGRGHRLEAIAPVPFRGPVDVAARIFTEQWWTFPRFVASGGFARAWRATGAARTM